ncbi:alpha/beta hydrolase [Aquincola sp. S2]|uniref:Alpha/beta hydrolase n=2 Tax=Pseudaquabacterium terrae TaxID=2732868 RepID=A0ABX2ED81_9BURK|nr:alpha/beta hydrolase [Aquabacterium terrae]
MLGIGAAAVGAAALPLASRAQRAAAHDRSGTIRTKDGVELFVKDWGQGRPLILTHAWPLSSDCWEQPALAIAEAGYRVISYDRRGFGRSSQPSTGYDYNTFADDLATVIQATGARDATLAGFSMGGGEIVRYLSRHGSKGIAKVALVAAVVPGLARNRNNPQGVDPAFFDGLKDSLRKDRATFLAGLLREVFYDVQTSARSTNPVSQAVLDWSLQMAMQASLRALIGSVDAFGKEDFVPDLAAVTVPTLILHGSADKPVPFELTARRAAAGIRQARLVEYGGTSHGLLVTERARVTQDLLDWLAA